MPHMTHCATAHSAVLSLQATPPSRGPRDGQDAHYGRILVPGHEHGAVRLRLRGGGKQQRKVRSQRGPRRHRPLPLAQLSRLPLLCRPRILRLGNTTGTDFLTRDSKRHCDFRPRTCSFGVIPTVCTLLFDAIRAREARGEASVAVTATYVQIYREQVYDLLHSAGGGGGAPPGAPQAAFGRGGQRGGTRAGGLRLRWLPGRGFYLEDVALVSCSSAGDALAAFRAGVKNKVMAGHRLNHASSRSHALFTLNIVVTPTTGGGGGGGGGVGGREGVLRAKLTLVDLAGSERTAMTGNTGVRLAESLFINKSLFTLRKVISVLADAARDGLSEKALFVPYRDSKLTSLLQARPQAAWAGGALAAEILGWDKGRRTCDRSTTFPVNPHPTFAHPPSFRSTHLADRPSLCA